jgi:hypothetical protein
MNISHTLIDERSRAMDGLIAQKIRANPSLMAQVRAQVEHKLRVHRDSGCRTAALEWKQILEEWPLERVLAFIQEDSERANRLRQSTPFIGILTDEERREVYRRYDPRAA